MANAKRQALFVLGMHRSGTSAFSGVLANLGAQAPKTLMVPTKDNPQGYWESLELLKAHDRILDSAGSRWNDWGPFNPAWIETAAAEEFIALIPQLIKSEFGDAGLILIKDPRVCRFFPLWQIALRKSRITPKVVIPVRHPLEVARSLELRDHFGRNRSLLLWLRHVLDAEASTREVARTFVRYDQLLDDWQTSARKISRDLDIQWPKWSGDTESRITDFLSSELRHHRDADKPVPGGGELAEWANQTYQVLQQLAGDGQPPKPALESLDRIRHEFDRTSAMYAAVVREHETRMEGLYNKKKAELADKSQQLGERNEKYEQLALGYTTAEQSIAKLRSKTDSLTEQLAETSRQLGERNKKYEDLARSYSTGQQSLVELQAKLVEKTQQLGDRNDKYKDLANSHAALTSRLAEKNQALAELQAKLVEKTQQLGERNDKYKDLANSHAALTANLAEKNQALAELQATLVDKTRQLGERNEKYKDLANSHATLTTHLAEKNQQLAERHKKYEELARSYSTTQQSLAEHKSRLAEKTQELGERNKKYADLAHSYSTAQQSLAEHKTRAAVLADQLESKYQEQAQMLSLVRQDIEAMAARLAARDTERNELSAILDKAMTRAEAQAREIVDLREAAAKSAASMEERFKETAKLTSMLFDLEEKLAGANQALAVAETLRGKLVDENQRLADQVASLRGTDAQRERRLALLEHALAGSSHEIARQGHWIDFHRRHAAQVQAELDAIQASAMWKVTNPFRRQRSAGSDAPMPPEDDVGQQIALLQDSELFDPHWYLQRYPEVAESGLEPAHHFLRSGSASGYNPSTAFDTVEYLVRYPDVRLSGMNPLVHYIEYGSKEGRVATAGSTG
jgi:hypothetical protein